MGHGDTRMSYLKNNSFQDRASASLEAKKALLAKMKVKPTVTAPDDGPDRAAIKAAELAELRAKREAERAERRRVAAEADALRREIEAFNAETAELELRTKQKAARDARYAARKQRRK
ncbi:DUF6481 family protein [Phenylobacterium sp.]|uniref:DUF6481 family protein n=1 Tax=Phenylobacterium sp. TaxID=1871053 RepID=UPI0035B46891